MISFKLLNSFIIINTPNFKPCLRRNEMAVFISDFQIWAKFLKNTKHEIKIKFVKISSKVSPTVRIDITIRTDMKKVLIIMIYWSMPPPLILSVYYYDRFSIWCEMLSLWDSPLSLICRRKVIPRWIWIWSLFLWYYMYLLTAG